MANNNIIKPQYKTKQFRFFGKIHDELNGNQESSIENNISLDNSTDPKQNTITQNDLISSSWFRDNYCPIVKIGIQTLPGVRFAINFIGEENNMDNTIIIGMSGIYELDLIDSQARINSLAFSADSLNTINNNPGGYLIIDIMYESKGG